MRLDKQQIDWIVDEFKLGREIDDICLDTGLSSSSIKRALSEGGQLDLSWHKSEEQHAILQHLRANGITTLTQLQGKI